MSRLPQLRPEDALFGSATSSNVLLALEMLESATISELARTAEADPSAVMRVVDRLEFAGLLETTRQGRNRLVRFSSRLRFKKELLSLLVAIGRDRTDIRENASADRKRPRRKGKGP